MSLVKALATLVFYCIAVVHGARHNLPENEHSASLSRREIPQEWSHKSVVRTADTWLKKNNSDGIVDAIFGLLGDKTAGTSAGKFDITKLHCLQKRIADVAFTNAAMARDRLGAEAAIKYAALERNSPAVGLATKDCLEGDIVIVNLEIAGIPRHQDPASEGATEINQKSTLAVAKSLKMIGADPLTATEVGTFKPGEKTDPTARGYSCDDFDTPGKGCIFENGRLVIDVTPEQIQAAVADIKCNPLWCK